MSDDGGDGGESRERGVLWGRQVAEAVYARRQSDFTPQPPFYGDSAVGQWRMTPNCNQQVGMTALSLASTDMFVLDTNRQFQPAPPRTLLDETYVADFNAVKTLGRATGIQPQRRSDRAGAVLGRKRERSLEPGGQPDCARQPSVHGPQQPAAGGTEPGDG